MISKAISTPVITSQFLTIQFNKTKKKTMKTTKKTASEQINVRDTKTHNHKITQYYVLSFSAVFLMFVLGLLRSLLL